MQAEVALGCGHSDGTAREHVCGQVGDGDNFTAGVGDRFFINGDFISSAEFHIVPLPVRPFNTTGAEIHFAGGGVHQYFTTPGSEISSSVIVDPADTLNLLSGSIAQNVINHGTLTITSGSASLSNLAGDGNLMLGNASGSQFGILIATAVTQGNVVIGNNSALRLCQGTQSTTSALASLLINSSGKVDLGKNSLILNCGTSNNGWIDGDFNLDGKVNSADMQPITLSGNHKGILPFAAPSASTAPANGVPSISYDPATGDVTLLTHGTAGIDDLHLLSAGQQFDVGHTAFTSFVTTTPGELESTLFDGNFTDGYDLGRILPTGLCSAAVQSDVTLMYSTVGGVTERSPTPRNRA